MGGVAIGYGVHAPEQIDRDPGCADLVVGVGLFASRLLGKHVTRLNALESLVISGWGGLSDRDIEAALREALGDEATVGKSSVSRICEQIKDEFGTWRTRDLSGVSIGGRRVLRRSSGSRYTNHRTVKALVPLLVYLRDPGVVGPAPEPVLTAGQLLLER